MVRPATPPAGTLVRVVWQACAPDGYDFHAPGLEPQTVEGRVVDVTDNHLHVKPKHARHTVGVRLDWIVDLEDITPECTFEPCPKDAETKGLCGTHWTQQHRGRPLTMPKARTVDLIHDLLDTRGGWWTVNEIAERVGVHSDNVQRVLRRNPDRFASRADALGPTTGRVPLNQYRSKVALWETDGTA